MGISEEELLNPESISETLRCPVCFEVFDDPVFCGGRPCQHVFCRECVEKAVRATASPGHGSGDGGRSYFCSDDEAEEQIGHCPSCRASIRLDELQPHQVMRSLLDELLVRCRWSCGWTGRRDSRAAHESPGTSQCPLIRLEAARAELANLSGAGGKLKDRDSRILQLEARIAEQDNQMVDLGRQLLAREVRIAELEGRLEEQERSIMQKDMELSLLRRGRAGLPSFESPSVSPQHQSDEALQAEEAAGGGDLWL